MHPRDTDRRTGRSSMCFSSPGRHTGWCGWPTNHFRSLQMLCYAVALAVGHQMTSIFFYKGFRACPRPCNISQASDFLQRAAPCSFIICPGQPLVLLSLVQGRASASGRCFRKTSAHFVEVSSGRLRMARSGCPLAQESSVEGRIRRLNI